MFKLTPILLAVLYGLGMYFFSSFRLKRDLTERSEPLRDNRLLALTQKMADPLDLPNLKVNIFDIEPINGLAAPDGRIFITKGFMDKYRLGDVSAEEMASVIAHELGHVALGHTRRRMIDFSAQNALRTGLMMIIGRFIPIIGPWIANFLVHLIATKMSRNDEYEADAYAAALLTKAGIGTDPQKSLFLKLDRLTGKMGSPPGWMMTHPDTKDRIAAIEKLEAKWSGLPTT